ncbi:hypothetical protein Val02_69300 [Virgisporangium aliadipatigenens]|uniref:HD domain-containing protein n=1 Tax=Virgisporangium aliadipatigenens TaxID=741659 RepID=A0A8J3YQN9_9ACTN|nr:HD domain-containing protein [Virgisporangium aliadipatigenens]GIJ50044.1 hypothetical protein Val02_69300 [Virgisporangium aliadipatigenens]
MGSLPRHPLVADALRLARTWCDGHVIDQAPAIAHAVRVATVLTRTLDPAPSQLVAAALLHDAPYFAPTDTDLDELLTNRFGPAVAQTVRGLEAEHVALDHSTEPDLNGLSDWTVYASAADKVASLTSILRRATHSGDTAAYFRDRPKFVARVPYFNAFAAAAKPRLPHRLAEELHHVTDWAATEAGQHTNSLTAAPPRG